VGNSTRSVVRTWKLLDSTTAVVPCVRIYLNLVISEGATCRVRSPEVRTGLSPVISTSSRLMTGSRLRLPGPTQRWILIWLMAAVEEGRPDRVAECGMGGLERGLEGRSRFFAPMNCIRPQNDLRGDGSSSGGRPVWASGSQGRPATGPAGEFP
jgi:hypothetical protein